MKEEKKITMLDFKSLYEEYGPMVLRRCRFLLKDEEKALDAMQDVFVRVIEKQTLISSVCSSLFYTIATRVCLNKIRSDGIRKGVDIDDILYEISDNNTANHEDVVDADILLNLIFAETKKDTKEMAIMHYVDGYTLEETAMKMNMSVSGVRKRLMKLRQNALKM